MFGIFICQEENLVIVRAEREIDIAVCRMLFIITYIFQPHIRPKMKKLWKTLKACLDGMILSA